MGSARHDAGTGGGGRGARAGFSREALHAASTCCGVSCAQLSHGPPGTRGRSEGGSGGRPVHTCVQVPVSLGLKVVGTALSPGPAGGGAPEGSQQPPCAPNGPTCGRQGVHPQGWSRGPTG